MSASAASCRARSTRRRAAASARAARWPRRSVPRWSRRCAASAQATRRPVTSRCSPPSRSRPTRSARRAWHPSSRVAARDAQSASASSSLRPRTGPLVTAMQRTSSACAQAMSRGVSPITTVLPRGQEVASPAVSPARRRAIGGSIERSSESEPKPPWLEREPVPQPGRFQLDPCHRFEVPGHECELHVSLLSELSRISGSRLLPSPTGRPDRDSRRAGSIRPSHPARARLSARPKRRLPVGCRRAISPSVRPAGDMFGLRPSNPRRVRFQALA